MALCEKLITKERLIKFGINVDSKCCLSDCMETIEHLFFECKITNKIWKQIFLWMYVIRKPNCLTKEMDWLINVFDSLIGTLLNIKGKTKDTKKSCEDMVVMGIRQELAPKEV